MPCIQLQCRYWLSWDDQVICRQKQTKHLQKRWGNWIWRSTDPHMTFKIFVSKLILSFQIQNRLQSANPNLNINSTHKNFYNWKPIPVFKLVLHYYFVKLHLVCSNNSSVGYEVLYECFNVSASLLAAHSTYIFLFLFTKLCDNSDKFNFDKI